MRGRPRFRPERESASSACSTRSRHGASSCAVHARGICRLSRFGEAAGDGAQRCRLHARPRRPPRADASARRSAGEGRRAARARARTPWRRHRLRAGRPAADRRGQPADLQPRRCRPAISVRQFASGEGPAAGRRTARRLSRPHRARPPPDRRLVPGHSARARSTSTSTPPRPRSASAIRRRCAD